MSVLSINFSILSSIIIIIAIVGEVFLLVPFRPFVEARAAHHGVSMYEEIGE